MMDLYSGIVALAVAAIAAIGYVRTWSTPTEGNRVLFLVSAGATLLGLFLILYYLINDDIGGDRHRTTFWEFWLGRKQLR